MKIDRLLVSTVSRVALLLSPCQAWATNTSPEDVTTASGAVAPQTAPASVTKPVVWNPAWARFRWWEYLATAGVMTGAFSVRFLGPSPPEEENVWDFEKDIADALAIRGGARDTIGTLGDIGYLGTVAYRFVDSALIPSLYWGQPDVAWQMFMMDVEAFSVTAAVLWTSQALIGRERPRYRDCPDEAPPGTSCTSSSDNRYRSFIMGHFTVAATGASLTCVHHAHLGLYGGGVADDVACGAHVTAAAVVAFARLTGEEHYLSDALLGAGLGIFAGYVVPSALHYGFGSEGTRTSRLQQTRRPATGFRVTLLPFFQQSGLGAIAVGSY